MEMLAISALGLSQLSFTLTGPGPLKTSEQQKQR
jgi:hypothetical protein